MGDSATENAITSLSWSWGFPPKDYELPDGAGSYAAVEAAMKAADEAKSKLIDAENEYLASMEFKMELDHENEAIMWKLPPNSCFHSGYMTRKNAIDHAAWLERSAKYRAEKQIKKLKEKHKIDE